MENKWIEKQIETYFLEDEIFKNQVYLNQLPKSEVSCSLKIKDDILVAGMPFFTSTFNYLLGHNGLNLSEFEGNKLNKGDEINFKLPFNIALSGERIALNLLQHCSSIATFTSKFVKKLEGSNIKLLDTRKTTPGLRTIEKYATNIGGAFNHRLSQMDAFMIKDNHKAHFGGLDKAIEFFKNLNSFYTPLIVEIHDLEELKIANEYKVNHLMLDNFTPDEVRNAIALKSESQTYEVSGGITLETIEDYKIEGIDAISVGKITYDAPHVDISLKYGK
jgi:nicotinate-nucleotide pyrophosphorylase (carboxylating)